MPNSPKETLQALLRVVDTKGQIDSFLQAFQLAVKTLNEMKSAVGSDLNQLRITFDQAVKTLTETNLKDFTDTKGQLQRQIVQALKEQQDGLNYMRDWVRNLPQAKDGVDGKDADEQAIITAVLAQIPPDVEETAIQTRDKLETLEGDERIDASAIKGLPEATKQIAQSTPGWGAHPLNIYQSGTIKAETARHINFTGATVSQSQDGITTVAITGGSGFSTLAATETPNGSLTVFTFSTATAQPSYLVVDNVWQKATTAAGTVNWTWNNGTKKATLTIPAVDDIWGVV